MRPLPRTLLLLLLFSTVSPAMAQLDGARVYWPLPKNMNVLGLHVISGTVNATLTNVHFIQPSLDIENQLALLTYSRSQPVLGRSFVVTATLPAGLIKTDSSLPIPGSESFVHGVGDPSLGMTINLLGAPGLMLREYARYDLHSVVSFNLTATLPVGQYDETQSLNIGSNQARVRFALPAVQSLGPWVPGDRTTLEITPSLTWIADNGDSRGQTLEQDPLLAVESHLTRDITRDASISADYSFLRFGALSRIDNTSGMVAGMTDAREAHLLGLSLNFKINDNLTMYATHMQTFAANGEPAALEGALFRVTLLWAFHRVIERRRGFVEGS